MYKQQTLYDNKTFFAVSRQNGCHWKFLSEHAHPVNFSSVKC